MFNNLNGVKANNLEGATPGATPMGPVDEAPRQSEQDNGDDSPSSDGDIGAKGENVNLNDDEDGDNQNKKAFQETGAFLSDPMNWTAPDKTNKKQNDNEIVKTGPGANPDDGSQDFDATAKINQSETRRSIVTDADVEIPARQS